MKRALSSLFLILALLIGAVSAGMHGSEASAAPVDESPTYYVNLSSSGFDPNSLVIPRNSTVVFVNVDTVNHSVTSTNAASAGPNSGAIPPGQTYSFTFQSLGPFTLVDSLNPSATATITVVAPGSPGITPPNAPPNTTKGEGPDVTPTTSANGPVDTGHRTSMQAYVPALALGTLCIGAAVILLFARHRKVSSGN